MGYGKQLPIADLTPATEIFVPQLDEIDGTVMLVVPASRQDFPLVVVDLHDRAWTQDGEHRKVRNADQSVNTLAQVQVLQKPDRDLSPYLREARQQARLVQLEVLAGFQGNVERLPVALLSFRHELCFRRRVQSLVSLNITDAQAKKGKQMRPALMVQDGNAIKTNIGDSLNVVIQIERRPGRRFISEVLEINSYDPDADLFDFCAIYVAPRERT